MNNCTNHYIELQLDKMNLDAEIEITFRAPIMTELTSHILI